MADLGWRRVALAFALALASAASAGADESSREQALAGLADPAPPARLQAVERLAAVGEMRDVAALVQRLRDDDATVRAAAAAAMWQVWSRSGDPAVDALLARGTAQMGVGELDEAHATFDEVVRRRPDFAEGWNKRATVLFLLGRDAESLRDCDEVLRRNGYHFGALSGMTQIHLRRDDPERALAAWRRALEINPHLDRGAEILLLLDQAARQRRGEGT